jgi:hypothetical protein
MTTSPRRCPASSSSVLPFGTGSSRFASSTSSASALVSSPTPSASVSAATRHRRSMSAARRTCTCTWTISGFARTRAAKRVDRMWHCRVLCDTSSGSAKRDVRVVICHKHARTSCQVQSGSHCVKSGPHSTACATSQCTPRKLLSFSDLSAPHGRAFCFSVAYVCLSPTPHPEPTATFEP